VTRTPRRTSRHPGVVSNPEMNLAIAILIVAGATATAIAAMLLVRRKAPDGSYFHDGTAPRASSAC
jgi:hypothetical protein